MFSFECFAILRTFENGNFLPTVEVKLFHEMCSTFRTKRNMQFGCVL